jgi:hypothetical protein
MRKETKRKEALNWGSNVSRCEVVSAGADEWASENRLHAYLRQGFVCTSISLALLQLLKSCDVTSSGWPSRRG